MDDFRQAIQRKLSSARRLGKSSIELVSGDLHRELGGYPGTNHAMPSCCNAMYEAMKSGDQIVSSPPKRLGATLRIKYIL
jgi:5-methylcytosine-specific restriction protein A